MGLEIIWNIHCKSLRQKGTNLFTSARGKFKLWKMAEKIKTCSRRRIDGGHNVVCDVGPNVVILDVGLRSSDIASSYNGNIGSRRNNVFTNNARIFLLKMGLRKKRKKKKVEGFYVNQRDFFL